ncbi:MAG: DUF4105 domain-containing protein [Ekhidna sp.]|nr:DUF4105 domain-containing protein [Ekhidna sp.]
MRLLGLLLSIFIALGAQGQILLSEEAEISVVTLGPYQGEPWSAFGHNGFRVEDPGNGVDWFYDYGLYDFNQENFFLNFARGLLKYQVGVRKWERTLASQKRLDRYIKLQYLNLTAAEKQQLFDFLQHNVRPENAEYLYHYVYDNCATKIRDVVEHQFPSSIEFDLSYARENRTIRQLMDEFLSQQAWGDFGIDIGLGLEIDRAAKPEEYMFLPFYVHKAFAGAVIKRGDQKYPLVKSSVDVFIPEEESSLSVLITPFNLFLILFFAVGLITHRNLKFEKRTKWIDTFFFGFAGFVGLWVVYLWFGTEHMSKNNLNIFWAVPLHLPILFMLWKRGWLLIFQKYFLVAGVWYSVLLIIWAILPQPLHQALVPLVLAMVLRSFYLSYYFRRLARRC